jgi:Zn finger protein HypA/HybF involved in hydrogenase expression
MGNSITKPKYTDRLAHGMPLRRPEEDVACARRCMGCGGEFESEGWHNRLCPQCRKRS